MERGDQSGNRSRATSSPKKRKNKNKYLPVDNTSHRGVSHPSAQSGDIQDHPNPNPISPSGRSRVSFDPTPTYSRSVPTHDIDDDIHQPPPNEYLNAQQLDNINTEFTTSPTQQYDHTEVIMSLIIHKPEHEEAEIADRKAKKEYKDQRNRVNPNHTEIVRIRININININIIIDHQLQILETKLNNHTMHILILGQEIQNLSIHHQLIPVGINEIILYLKFIP